MSMAILKAVVQNGRAVIEDLSNYPDGTVLELEVMNDSDSDDLDDDERVKLHAALDRSWAQAQEGKQGNSFNEIIKRL